MIRWKALALGLPTWTLLMLGVWLIVPWVFYSPPCVPRTVSGSLSADCAAALTAGSLAVFYLQVVPLVAIWLGGYAFVAGQALRSGRSRIRLVAIWIALVVAFAILARPLPIPPILET